MNSLYGRIAGLSVLSTLHCTVKCGVWLDIYFTFSLSAIEMPSCAPRNDNTKYQAEFTEFVIIGEQDNFGWTLKVIKRKIFISDD